MSNASEVWYVVEHGTLIYFCKIPSSKYLYYKVKDSVNLDVLSAL